MPAPIGTICGRHGVKRYWGAGVPFGHPGDGGGGAHPEHRSLRRRSWGFIRDIQVLSIGDGRVSWMKADDAGLAYRDSVFKQNPGRWIVLAVRFVLPANECGHLDYPGAGP